MNVLYRQINEQELKDDPDASAAFRERFAERSTSTLLPGDEGMSDLRAAVLDAAPRADGRWSASCC